MLSEENKEILNKLVDPDQHTKSKYNWDEDFQREIIGMLLTNKVFVCQTKGLIESNYFSNEIHQQISRQLFGYFEEYSTLPSKIYLRNALMEHLKERYANQPDTFETTRLLYVGELNNIYDYYSKSNIGQMQPWLDSPDSIIDKIVVFAKVQAVRSAFIKCLGMIKKSPDSDKTWLQFDEEIKKARLVDRKQDLGLMYYETVDERYARMKENQDSLEVFSTCFPTLNSSFNAGGPIRGDILAVMAAAGKGKSLFLVNCSVANLSLGKKVLYITTEMDQDAVGSRFDSMISVIGKHELLPRENEVKHALLDHVHDWEDKRRLIIKQMPSGTADVNTIKAYHSQLGMYGFKPDIVVVDYIGDLRDVPGISMHQSRFQILRDLKGFGQQEGHFTLTAIHPQRGVNELKVDEVIDEDKMADSILMFRVLDCFISINQTDSEALAGMARIHNMKMREGRKKDFKIQVDYTGQTLRMEEVSNEKYRASMACVSAKTADEMAESIVANNSDSGYVQKKKKKFNGGDGERVDMTGDAD